MTLTTYERGVLAKVLAAVLPFDEGADEASLAAFADHFFATAPFETCLGVRAALWVATLAPLFVLGRLRTIASLSPNARANVLAHLAESRVYALRELPMLLKMVAGFAVLGAPAARALVGVRYDDDRPAPWSPGASAP